MATTIEDYLKLDIADLVRLGFIRPRSARGGDVTWKRGTTTTAQIYVKVDTTAAPMCYLSYSYNGEPRQESIRLLFKRSNLAPGSERGYYYFVCPATGKCCRKLYAVGGRFISRSAFRPLYPLQALSRKQREEIAYYDGLYKLDELQQSRYRKEFYRGKPTRYRRKMERYIERSAPNNPLFSRFKQLLSTEQ